MSENCRFDVNLHVSRQTAEAIERMAKERAVPKTTLVLQALGILHAVHEGVKDGYHAGLVKDRSKLDTLLVLPL